MEGILFNIELFESPIAVVSGLILLVIAACSVLLIRMADKEANGESVFWAESPFTDVGTTPPAEAVRYPRAA